MNTITKEYRAGAGLKRLAIKHHKDWQTIRSIVTNDGVSIRNKTKRKINPENAERLYLAGQSSITIARKYSCAPKTVRDALRKRKVLLRNFDDTKYRKYQLNTDLVCNIQSEIGAYWLGFLLADGYITPNRHRLVINLQANDIGHLYKLTKHLGTYKQPRIAITTAKGKTKKRSTLTINSKELCNFYRNIGWNEFKNGECIPSHTRHLLRGLWDGDGIVTHNNKYLRMGFCNPHYSITKAIQLITINYVYKSYGIIIRENKLNLHNNCWYCWWVGKPAVLIAKMLYFNQSVCLDRKLHKVSNYIF